MHAPRRVTALAVCLAAAGALVLTGCGSDTNASAPTEPVIGTWTCVNDGGEGTCTCEGSEADCKSTAAKPGFLKGATGTDSTGPAASTGATGAAGANGITGATGPQGPAWKLNIHEVRHSEIVSGQMQFDLTASCPAGEIAISGGYQFRPDKIATDFRIWSSHLAANSSGWTINITNLNGGLPNEVTVIANCVAP